MSVKVWLGKRVVSDVVAPVMANISASKEDECVPRPHWSLRDDCKYRMMAAAPEWWLRCEPSVKIMGEVEGIEDMRVLTEELSWWYVIGGVANLMEKRR